MKKTAQESAIPNAPLENRSRSPSQSSSNSSEEADKTIVAAGQSIDKAVSEDSATYATVLDTQSSASQIQKTFSAASLQTLSLAIIATPENDQAKFRSLN